MHGALERTHYSYSSLALVALGLLAPGCTVHRAEQRPEPPVALAAAFSDPGAAPAQPELRWWRSLGDPELEQLVDRALSGGFDLRRGWERLQQARALATQSGASQWPQLNAEAGFARSRNVVNTGTPLGTVTQTANQFSLGLAASYELDLWGRLRAGRAAAALDLAASRADVETLAISVAAQVSEAWFGLREQREQLRLLEAQLQLSETFLSLVELRFAQGLASALDVLQQRQLLASTRAQLPPLRLRRAQLEHQLELLLGAGPGQLVLPASQGLPTPAALPGLGLPADLLQQRPDLRAARLRAAAADERIAVALADRFPALRLGASTGWRAPELADLFSSWVYSLSANLVAPLIDGQRRAAEVDRSRAAQREALLAYGQLALKAVLEVEDTLAGLREQDALLREQEGLVTLGQTTLAEAKARYLQGTTDYLPVLTALSALQQAERQRLATQRQLLTLRVQLHRTLGGTWPQDLAPPPPPGAAARRAPAARAEPGPPGAEPRGGGPLAPSPTPSEGV